LKSHSKEEWGRRENNGGMEHSGYKSCIYGKVTMNPFYNCHMLTKVLFLKKMKDKKVKLVLPAGG
jgi:hypothetical protein